MDGVSRRWLSALMAATLGVAVLGARPYAGGWNDGSRLATIESLVDRHTLVIDDSIFVRVPAQGSPYDPNAPVLRNGTLDRLFIGGHFYSDKPPLSAALLAALYQLLQWTIGLNARDQPERFCYLMNFAGAGVPYLVAVWSVAQIAAQLALSRALQLLLPASFALATVAPAYARHVNGHIQLLAAAAIVYRCLLCLADTKAPRVQRTRAPVVIGAALGVAYGLDLAAGPLLLACTLPLVGTRGGWRASALCGIAAVPGIALHHVLNYAAAGTLLPANMTPDYFRWPGSPIEPATLTGAWHHTPLEFLSYAIQLLFGRHGFFLHNLPLLLLIVAAGAFVARPFPECFAAVHAACWSVATWLIYAIGSDNYSGQCLSIRWFVPLLVPGYMLLALLVRDHARWRTSFGLLSGWGLLLACAMWSAGPWTARHVPGLWMILGAALASWAALWVRTRQGERAPTRPRTGPAP